MGKFLRSAASSWKTAQIFEGSKKYYKRL